MTGLPGKPLVIAGPNAELFNGSVILCLLVGVLP